MLTQSERVLLHMQRYGWITDKVARDRYGITRLSARIRNLKDAGHTITTDMIPVMNRDKRKTYVGCYRLGVEK